MPITITYTIWIDRNRNGLQTSGEIITSDVIALKWRLGMTQPYDTMAPPGWAEIILDARSGGYSGTNGAALLGCCVTVLSNDGTTTRTHFVGFIDKIVPAAGDYGPRTTRLHAQTRDATLADHTPAIVPTALGEAETLIGYALSKSGMPYRVTAGYSILNDPGAVVGTAKLFADVEDYSADVGLTTLAYGGAWSSSDSPRANALIAEIVASERGRFFCGRDGTLYLFNRHALLQTLSNAATLTNDMADLTVSSGEDIINDIEIQVIPRRVGAQNSLLWTLDRSLQLAPGELRHLQIPFHDEETLLVGALPTLRCVLTVVDQDGDDVTQSVSAWLNEITFTGALLSLRHPYPNTITLISVMVYGTPLYRESPQTARVVDMPSVMQYGRRHRWLNLSALSTLEQAEDIARYEVSRRKTPRSHASTVTLSTQTHAQQVLACTLYDCLTISETQSLPVGKYMICAEEHHVQEGGAVHHVTWLLEPVDSDVFACVGGILDNAHLIAY